MASSPTTLKKTFFSLPRELRDIIYELTFTRTVDLVLSTQCMRHSNGSLFLTSHRIHDEVAKLYYERTLFYATNVDRLVSWITALPPKSAEAIKTIRCTRSAAWILEKLWEKKESRGIAVMLSRKRVLKEWRCVEGERQWAATDEWALPMLVLGKMRMLDSMARVRAIP